MDIGKAKQWLTDARRVAVLTGAGISAESGIPTFRGPGGLWRTYRPDQLATPEAFARDPQMVWEWYQWRRGLIAAAEPNAGHCALAVLERSCEQFTLITQNVDGLHDRAGSRRVLKIHGDIWHVRCTACAYQRRDTRLDHAVLPPPCPECGNLLRPGVVWFGEPLPRIVWNEAERAVNECEVLLVAGTSAAVYPAAGLIGRATRVIEVNTEETAVSGFAGISLRGPCGDILPQLI